MCIRDRDDVAEIIGISNERVQITQELGVKKPCAKWLPYLELLNFLGVQYGGRGSSSILVRARLNSSAHIQTFGFEVPASPDTFTFSF